MLIRFNKSDSHTNYIDTLWPENSMIKYKKTTRNVLYEFYIINL